MPAEQLELLVQQFQAREPQAEDELLLALRDLLLQRARALFPDYPRVRQWMDVDDVVQNVMLRLQRCLRDVKPVTAAEVWTLAQVQLHRELLDSARSLQAPKGEFAFGALRGSSTERLDNVLADAADDDGTASLVHEAILALPVREREVMALLYYHGWSQAQIAELFGVDTRTVRRWQRSSFEQLRRLLRAPGSSPAHG
jgi:RNA polymerase sigma factor (sigma-70 family)